MGTGSLWDRRIGTRRGEIGPEGIDDLHDHPLDAVQSSVEEGLWEPERWLDGRLAVHVHLWSGTHWFAGSTHHLCAIFQQTVMVEDDLSAIASIIIRGQPESGINDAGLHGDTAWVDHPMLVHIREIAQPFERFSPGMVRLKALDDCPVFAANPLDPAFDAAGRPAFVRRDDRKLCAARFDAIQQGQLPNELIKGGAQIMNKLSEDHPDHRRRFLEELRSKDVGALLGLELTRESVRFFPQEPLPFPVKASEIRFCPCELRVDPSKGDGIGHSETSQEPAGDHPRDPDNRAQNRC